jgi:hypothetical protein
LEVIGGELNLFAASIQIITSIKKSQMLKSTKQVKMGMYMGFSGIDRIK